MTTYAKLIKLIRGLDNSTPGEVDGDASLLQVCESKYWFLIKQIVATFLIYSASCSVYAFLYLNFVILHRISNHCWFIQYGCFWKPIRETKKKERNRGLFKWFFKMDQILSYYFCPAGWNWKSYHGRAESRWPNKVCFSLVGA